MLHRIMRLCAPDGGGAAGGTGGGTEGTPSGTATPPSGTATPPSGTTTPPPDAATKAAPSFDDLMKDPAFKAEYDKRSQATADAARAEAERVAKLSAEERAAEEHRKFEADRTAFEHERLENEATKQLAQMGLPVELAPQLVGKDATATLANIQAFGKAFTSAVEKGVNDRIKGTTPKAGSTGASGASGAGKSSLMATVTDNQFKR